MRTLEEQTAAARQVLRGVYLGSTGSARAKKRPSRRSWPGAAGVVAAATVPRSVDGAGASGRQWDTEIPALEKTPTALQAVQNGETLK